jgi:hypothetical protein
MQNYCLCSIDPTAVEMTRGGLRTNNLLFLWIRKTNLCTIGEINFSNFLSINSQQHILCSQPMIRVLENPLSRRPYINTTMSFLLHDQTFISWMPSHLSTLSTSISSSRWWWTIFYFIFANSSFPKLMIYSSSKEHTCSFEILSISSSLDIEGKDIDKKKS